MNWHAANLAQLYEIAFNDPGANAVHKQAAAEEIQRRIRKKHVNANHKIKKVYPK
ncbi:hypothetical protein ACE3MQ_25135 [Paenibacillus lentus]|uniref:hypothetical protein n=1 Tax=Paenibacillus lentus TaxID=1338368 RepID=UPI003669FA03